MNDFLKHLWKHKVLTLLILVSSFLFGYTISNLVNTYSTTYSITYSVNNEIDFSNMLTKEYLLETKNSINSNGYYDEIDTDRIIKDNAISLLKNNDNEYVLTTKASYYPNFFLKSSNSVSTRAKTYLKTLINNYVEKFNKDISEENKTKVTFSSKNIIESNVPLNDFWVYTISTIFLVTLTSAYVIVEHIKYLKHKDEEEIEYDNKETFFSPFHKEYWKEVFNTFKSIKNISVIAMMLALMLLCKMFSLPSGFGNLGISLTYIIFATACMLYGPFAGIIIGILSDTLGFVLFQSGTTFFIGYTIQAALTGFIYGIMLYKTKFSYSRCFISRILVNILMNAVWGSICWGLVAGYTSTQTLYYALLFSLPKNIVYLVPQSIVLYFLIKTLCPALSRLGLIKKSQYEYFKKKELIGE